MPSFRSARAFAAIAAAALLSACAGQSATGPVSQVYYDYSFAGTEVGYAAQFNPIPVFFRGAPFANAADVNAMVGVMNRNRQINGLVFAPTSAPSNRGYLMIVVAGRIPPGSNPCNAPADAVGGPSSEGVQVSGVFCTTGRLRSSGVATAPGGDLRAAVDALTGALLSPDLDPGRTRRLVGDR